MFTAPGSPPLFLEYEEVLKRPEHRLRHGLTLDELDAFSGSLAARKNFPATEETANLCIKLELPVKGAR